MQKITETKEKLEKEINSLNEKLTRSPNENDLKEMEQLPISKEEEKIIEFKNEETGNKYHQETTKIIEEQKTHLYFFWGIVFGIAGSYTSSYVLLYLKEPITSILFIVCLFIIFATLYDWEQIFKRNNNWIKIYQNIPSYAFFLRWHKWREILTIKLTQKKEIYYELFGNKNLKK